VYPEVMEDDRAMVCDLCDKWEHVGCLKRSDKLANELYDGVSLKLFCMFVHLARHDYKPVACIRV